MLNLVDYDASDSEGDSSAENECDCVVAEVVTNPKKGINVPSLSAKQVVENGAKSQQPSWPLDDPEFDELPSAGSGSGILTFLPSAVPSDTSSTLVSAEAELEEIVKPKEWEIKLAEKTERKRRRHERKIKKLDEAGAKKHNEKKGKKHKKVKVDAFGGLHLLKKDARTDSEESEWNQDATTASKKRTDLLSILPQPRTENLVGAKKGGGLMLPPALRSLKSSAVKEDQSVPKHEVTQSKAEMNSVVKGNESDEDESDNGDFFGLKASSRSIVPSVVLDAQPAQLSSVSYGPARPERHLKEIDAANDDYGAGEAMNDFDDGGTSAPSTSGLISDQEAANLIYAHHVSPWGGTQSHANDALSNMVDASVDQALGPNVQATLLKNLHNKSLAESAIAHLSAIPKSKGPQDVVARRKHQITYLATMAVAREEQLAEQWSQGRQNKRVSAQKYGFF